VFRKVRDEVLVATDHRQEPFTYGALSSGELYLKPADMPVATAAAFPGLPAQVAAFETFFRTSITGEMAKFGEKGDVKFKILISEDLNDDSYLDFVVLNTSSYFCGSGGCSTEVYLAGANGSYSSVLDLFGSTSPRVSSHKTAGFKDIAAVKYTVHEQPVWSIHQWNGKEYALAYDQFCGQVAFEYCTEDDSSIIIDRIPDSDADRYTAKPGASLFDAPGGHGLKDKLGPSLTVVGKVRGNDWYLVQLWKSRAAFVSAKYIVRSAGR
jgi:hypothetical protein